MTRFRPTDDILAGGPPRETYRVRTSSTELLHVVIAFVVLTIDIALVRSQISVNGVVGGLAVATFVDNIGVSAAAALTGFVAHEMAHKVSAQRYGFWAEFRMSPAGLLFSLATALFGFLFALPGATVIGGMGNVREWGRTSLAGPLTNLVEGSAFLAASFGTVPIFHSVDLWAALAFLAFVNAIFAGFNLLPFGPLDGRKVYRWSRAIWAGAFGAALLFIGIVLTGLFLAVPTF
jgi:Zn-dependent protease